MPDTKSDLSDELIESVARKVIKKDWEELAISLGFTKREIQAYKSKYNDISYDTVFFPFKKIYNLNFNFKLKIVAIMLDWRDQDPKLATKNRLRGYLEELRMNEAAALIR